MASSRASLAEHDDALSEMSRRTDEFVAALASAEEKLAKRDDALSRAERELSDRSAAVEALQSEIITLRSILAVARDVGRAALAALRTEPATVSEAPWNAGWLAPVAAVSRLPRKGSVRSDKILHATPRGWRRRLADRLLRLRGNGDRRWLCTNT